MTEAELIKAAGDGIPILAENDVWKNRTRDDGRWPVIYSPMFPDDPFPWVADTAEAGPIRYRTAEIVSP